ncbi:hypothetical protein UPYG_G00294460 [Umbra pygmaea]|uniref:C2H2-type domain-containing protein n=1 Tax=Umbra pygmaea TaxID=75934 RepID=A0ABD0W694_UMBPY
MFPPNLFSNIIKHRKMPVSPMNVFPEEFGPKYDSTLQILAQEFLSRLEKLLPSPNLQQTASWLSIDPTLLEECVQSVAHPEPLQTLLQHHKNGHQLDSNALRSVGGDYILGSLSSHSSVKESSVYSQTGPERQSYPTMQGYQSPFPCEEPGTKWDCRMAEYRVWTVKPPAGSASVEVEVNEIEESSERTSKRKTVDKETVKETKRDKAVLCPQTRSGLKTSRLTASCLRRKPVLQLKRLDISNMALPKSLLTLILRRGRLQTEGEATRRPGPKRRGRKKKRRKGGGVTDEVTVTHTCDVSDMPPPKSSLTLTLKRGIMQAEATSSQVPKKRGRKKGPKTGPGITRLKIEKIGAESLDISDVPLPKPSLKLIIRRGKLQGEAIDSQGQIPKKRGRKKKHRRGIKDEKTQAKGAKRDMSAESEEDKPSDYELWTTVTQGSPVHKSTTLDQSGGVHVGPHCSSSHKRMDKELKKHTLHVHTEKHCAQMAVRQNCEEVLENVPQDSLTPELPNNSHKIQFHLEKHSGQMAERQKEEEFLESVQQDSRTEKLPLVSPTENLPQVSKKEKVPQVTVTEKVPQDSLTDKVPQDSLTEKVPQDSLTERVPQDSLTEKVPQESLTEKVPQESPTEKVPQEPPTEKVPQEPPTEKVPQESLSEKVPQESLTEKVPQESLTEKVPQESLTEKVPQESLTEKVPQDSFRNKVPQDLLTPEPSNTCHKRSQRVKACSFCGKTFTDTLGLTRHMRSHIEQRSHQCMECGQDFEFSEDLEEHQKHCKKLKKENVDYYCGENVQQKNDLKINSDRKRHKRNDLEGNEKLDLKGDEKIDVKVEEQSNLKADAHGSIKCHVCGKITTRMLGLRRHLLLHFNNGAFKCPACPKTFISNADLRSHLRLKQSCREKCPEEVVNTKVHLQSGPCESICPYCGDSFQLTHELKEHTKECSRKCHVCGKTTSKACDMRRHMLKHYNNGPIKCPVCPKTFISHPDFKMHLKTKKLCREKCSDVMMKELLSSVEGKCKDNINETEVVTKSQQPSSSSTSGPLKSIEEFFEEFSHDLQQSDNSMSSEVNLNSLNSLEEDYSEDMTLYQPMKDVNLNNLHVDYNEMGQYQPIKDDDLNSLQVDYSEDISQYQHIKDPEPEENRMSLDTSGANKISNDKEPNLDKGLTKKQMSHTDASPVQDSLSEKSGEVKNETQRGKLQAEETCSQEPKRRGRKRKQKRRCSVKTEKTEEQGVNKERSTETEEDAEPSNNEHWKTASKAATVNDSGGFHVRLHSQLSLEKEDLHHHKGIIEEHCSRMVNGQNRELLENVPQDSLTTEASNNFKKRSQRVKACSFCGKTFTDTLGLTRHMRSHIEQRSHQCMECGQHFEFVEDLEEHEYSGCEVRKNKTFESLVPRSTSTLDHTYVLTVGTPSNSLMI